MPIAFWKLEEVVHTVFSLLLQSRSPQTLISIQNKIGGRWIQPLNLTPDCSECKLPLLVCFSEFRHVSFALIARSIFISGEKKDEGL